MKETIKREKSHAGMSYPEREFARHGSVKRKFFGTIMCAMGIVFASGDTISCGIIACVCMAVGAIAISNAERKRYSSEELKVKSKEFATAA